MINNVRRSFAEMVLIEVAARTRAMENGRQFYYVPFKCSAGHYSRRSVVDCSCEKCWQPEERKQRMKAARLRREELKPAIEQRKKDWTEKRAAAKARREAIEVARKERLGWK